MKNYLKVTCVVAIGLLFFESCKKEKQGETTACKSAIYGYNMPDSASLLNITGGTCAYSLVNSATGVGSSMGSFISWGLPVQGAFNHSDNCYYVFKITSTITPGSVLYKISASGTVSTYTKSTAGGCGAIVYNRFNNKLYCAVADSLAEIVISGTYFTTNNLVATVHPMRGYNTTVNNSNGDVYYTTGDTTVYYIERYQPGGASSSVVASGTGAWSLLGLKFNNNDNMLYAVTDDHPVVGNHFIKINPSTGVVSSLSHLPGIINVDFYSTCLDPCSNRFLVSTMSYSSIGFDTCILNQYNMSGKLVQHDTTTGLFLGLDVDY